MEGMRTKLLKAEDTIIGVLRGCTIRRAMYHTITYSLPLYFPIDMPRIKGYEPPSTQYPDPIRKGRNHLYPLFNEAVHHYKSLNKDIYIDICESDRRYLDRISGLSFNLLLVHFRSGDQIVTDTDIEDFLNQLSGYLHYRLHQIRDDMTKGASTAALASRIPIGLQWQLFYLEPCVDITGSSRSINFLHKNLRDNLYMTRCKLRESRGGDSKGKKVTRDQRVLRNENTTDYISNKFRGYRYEKSNAHTLRVELQFDRVFLDTEEPRHPALIWNERYFFFILNMPKIIKRIEQRYHRYPSHKDSIMSVLNDDKITLWKKYEFIRDYGKVKKKKVWGRKEDKKKKTEKKPDGLFRSAREFLTPQWLTLHKFIGDAFSRISITNDFTDIMIPEPVFPQPTSKKEKTNRKIEEAKTLLKQKGIRITWDSVIKESGVSTYSLGRYVQERGSLTPV